MLTSTIFNKSMKYFIFMYTLSGICFFYCCNWLYWCCKKKNVALSIRNMCGQRVLTTLVTHLITFSTCLYFYASGRIGELYGILLFQ